MKKDYPDIVTKFITFCDAWIVGGAAMEDNPKDYDVFIPFKHWQLACSFIPGDAKLNRFGGFKCISDDREVDVWTGDMNDFLQSDFFTQCSHPKSGILIKRI